MLANPAWTLTSSDDWLDLECSAIEAIDRRFPYEPIAEVAQVADDIDPVIYQCCGMKIGGWKYVFGITINLEITLPIVNNDIIVDPKIWVVVRILLISTNFNDSPIRK